MEPVVIDLPPIVVGDTWEGLSVGPVLFNDAQPATELVKCRLYFRDVRNKKLAAGFTSDVVEGIGLINISNAETWCADIPAQPLPLAVGLFLWSFETTDAVGIVRTLYKGVLEVGEDPTHD
jgi:hypothetical protein